MVAASLKHAKVFISGATGLLGSHLTRQLIEQGAEVIALVRDSVPRSIFFSDSKEWQLDRQVNIVRGEIEDFNLIERVLNEYEVDTVFHLAAQTIVGTANRSPLATFRANIQGTWNVLEAARLHQKRICRVVVASSDKAYGNLQGTAYDETFPLRGEHPYDVSKSCADLIARSYFVTYGLPVAVTRCGNFFGPGDLNFNRLIPGTILDILRNKRPVIRSDGSYIRDYIFAEDGAHAYLSLAQAMVNGTHSGEAFNFSYGLKLTVLDVVSHIMKTMGRADLKPEILNEPLKEIPVQHLDSTKARKILDWKPKYGFDEGLKATLQWYTEHFG
ncbi:MAG: GDP-mannose 4,6-dehydratase [Deltaproteobacteria bacterium]|nr:GDP-mannose 4,6-dehydratase [Deltaproteobacteria bacterium]